MGLFYMSSLLVFSAFNVLNAVVIDECQSINICSEVLTKMLNATIPQLDRNLRKGEGGKIGVIGGSMEYTGAPYFSAITSLKVGADLVFVITTESAAPVIKIYSPDLIVFPFLSVKYASFIPKLIERMDIVIIGPGLGRDNSTMEMASNIISTCRSLKKPLIIDADALYLVSKNLSLIQNYPPPGVILLPNVIEKERIQVALNKANLSGFDKIGEFTSILCKGHTDGFISSLPNLRWSINDGGSGRRAGGQGDILAGSLGTFFNWALKSKICENTETNNLAASIAAYGAAKFTRKCNELAFEKHGRSMIASDMLKQIRAAFKELYGGV